MIFKKAIPRRTFLRGIGAAVALPALDAMIPAFASASSLAPVKRLCVVYVPNGRIMDDWTAATVGVDFELPRLLKPLAPHR